MCLAADQRLILVPIRTTPAFEADVPKPLFTAHVLFPGVRLRSHYDLSGDGQRFLMCAPHGAQSLSDANVVLNWFVEARRR